MAISTGAAIIGASVIGAGASLFGASTQADAAEDAAELQLAMFQRTRKDLRPWRTVGKQAIFELSKLYGLPLSNKQRKKIEKATGQPYDREEQQQAAFDRFRESPDYQFRLDEGIRAIDRSAAARGRLNSGATGRELARYGQGLAAAEYGNYTNSLMGLAGFGQTATQALGELGMSAARNAGVFGAGAGLARASGYTGAANVLTSGAEDLAYWNWRNQQPQLSGPFGGGNIGNQLWNNNWLGGN